MLSFLLTLVILRKAQISLWYLAVLDSVGPQSSTSVKCKKNQFGKQVNE